MRCKHYSNSSIYDVVAVNIKVQSGYRCYTTRSCDRTGYTHEYIRRIESSNLKGRFTIESVNVISMAIFEIVCITPFFF